MLTAILHGKAAQVEMDGLPITWRELFRKREDLLTSVFFGRLPYLSDEACHAIWSLLVGSTLAAAFGPLREVQFWPKLDGPTGRKYVEPDVVIEFDAHLLLVEVKPPFGGEQSIQQWRQEVEALRKSNDDGKAIVLLALGRNMPEWRSIKKTLENEFERLGLQVFCCEWEQLLEGVNQPIHQMDGRDARIFSDWLDAFQLFGMAPPKAPFSDLLPLCGSPYELEDSFVSLGRWGIR